VPGAGTLGLRNFGHVLMAVAALPGVDHSYTAGGCSFVTLLESAKPSRLVPEPRSKLAEDGSKGARHLTHADGGRRSARIVVVLQMRHPIRRKRECSVRASETANLRWLREDALKLSERRLAAHEHRSWRHPCTHLGPRDGGRQEAVAGASLDARAIAGGLNLHSL